MANFKGYETQVIGWATKHLVAAGAISLVVGIVIGALLF